MLSRWLLIACLILFVSGAAFAQTALEGIVHDSSGRPVPNASISLQHQDGGTVFATVSDSNGKFRLSAVEAGAYTLQVLAAGYFKSTYDFVLRAPTGFAERGFARKGNAPAKGRSSDQLPDHRS